MTPFFQCLVPEVSAAKIWNRVLVNKGTETGEWMPEIAVNLEYSNSGTNVRILTLDFSILVIKKIYFVQIRKM